MTALIFLIVALISTLMVYLADGFMPDWFITMAEITASICYGTAFGVFIFGGMNP